MINILYHDPHILICEKPPHVLSEADGSGNDILSLLKAQCGEEFYLVHRLDRGTGGAMLLAGTKEAAAKLSALIRARELQKEYMAILNGRPEARKGIYKDLLYRDSRSNKSYVVNRPRRGVKEASLEYTVLAESVMDGQPITLVKVLLHTGRTHQIRVQFATRKTPLLGDRRYGSPAKDTSTALWSYSLSFIHPFSGEELRVVSLPPAQVPWVLFDRGNYETLTNGGDHV